MFAALAEVADDATGTSAHSVGLLTTSASGHPDRDGRWLAAYCLVMILPAGAASVTTVARVGLAEAGRAGASPGVDAWIVRLVSRTRPGSEMLGWVLGIAGFLIARDAAVRLGLFEMLANR